MEGFQPGLPPDCPPSRVTSVTHLPGLLSDPGRNCWPPWTMYSRPGRIPGSSSLPAAGLVDPVTNRFRPLPQLEAAVDAAGVRGSEPVIAYCGGGISATIDLFLLHRLGYDNLTLYYASMG